MTAPEGLFAALGRAVVTVDDLDAALAFYRDVLGFRVLYDRTADGYRYLHVGVPGQEAAGLWLMPAAPGAPEPDDRPRLVLYTADLDAVRGRLRADGVRVWNERDEPGSRSLHLADPYGNVIIAAQPDESPPRTG